MNKLPVPVVVQLKPVHNVFNRFLRRPRHYIRWALIHCALTFFFADLLAYVWPAFNAVWGGVAHAGVAVAALFATFAEYLHDEEPPHVH